MVSKSLTPLQKLAISRAVTLSDAERASLTAGTHSVAVNVSIGGVVEIAPDQEYTPTSKIPLIPTLALAMKRMGFQRDRFLAIVEDAARDVLAADEEQREAYCADLGIADCETMFRKMVASLPKSTRKGAVKPTLVVRALAVETTVKAPRKTSKAKAPNVKAAKI